MAFKFWVRVCILFVFNALLFQNISAQKSKLDSLEKRLPIATGTDKIDVINEICAKIWRSDFERFLKLSGESEYLSKKVSYTKGLIQNDLNKCYRNFYQGNTDSMFFYSKRAIGTATAINNKLLASDALKFLGVAYSVQGQYDSSIKYFKITYELKSQIGDDEETVKILYNIANNYLQLSMLPEALHYTLKSAELDEKIGNIQGVAWDYNQIGIIYNDLKNYKLCEQYLIKAQKILTGSDDLNGLAENFNHFGTMYQAMGILDKAEVNFLKSLELYEKLNFTRGIAAINNNLSSIYANTKRYDKALEVNLKSLELKKILQDSMGIASSYGNLAEVYSKTGNPSKAIEYKLKSIEISERHGYLDYLKNGYQTLSAIYEKSNNSQEALKYYKKYTQIADSIFKKEALAQTAEMQTRYDTERKNKENELLKINNSYQALQIEDQARKSFAQILVFAAILVLLLSLLIWGFFLYKQFRTKQKIKTETEIKEAEEKERLRISQDLHDHVGAQLSYVITNLDWITDPPAHLKEHDQKIVLRSVRDASKQAILTLRETVWALNQTAVSSEDFFDKFKQYALKMSEFHPNLKLQFKEMIEKDFIISPRYALNLFRICQEAFGNALKHSKADLIEIKIECNATVNFCFTIHDNGKGFDINNVETKGHYGLENMQSRAADSNAEFELNSIPGKGTTVKVMIKN